MPGIAGGTKAPCDLWVQCSSSKYSGITLLLRILAGSLLDYIGFATCNSNVHPVTVEMLSVLIVRISSLMYIVFQVETHITLPPE